MTRLLWVYAVSVHGVGSYFLNRQMLQFRTYQKVHFQAKVESPTDVFDNSWDLYQSMLDTNLLKHQQLYTKVRFALETFQKISGSPLRILDLGCGDSYYISKTLISMLASSGVDTHTNNLSIIQSYHGIDPCPAAIATGMKNMGALHSYGVETTFTDIDALAFSVNCTEKYDVVFASFALHHLKLAEKIALFEELKSILASKFLVVICDIFLADEFMTREQYLEEWCSMIMNWVAVKEEGRQRIIEHARSCDYPESVSTYKQLVLTAGISSKPPVVLREELNGLVKVLAWLECGNSSAEDILEQATE